MKSRLARALALLWISVAGATAAAPTQTAVEYYYAAWDYYFVTAFPDEIAVLDGGAFGGVWKRTGQTFAVWSQPVAGALPTCRFFSTAFAPKSSHFYTPGASECDGLKHSGSWQYESIAFHLELPDAEGACPAGTAVLYRLYNNGMGGAPNHRYTTSASVFAHMQSLGWTFEGDGRTGAFACVPSGGPTAEGLWRGTSTDGRIISVAVLDDGTFYIAYSSLAGTSFDGGVYGTGTSQDGGFVSVSARSIPLRGVFANGSTSISGTYAPHASLSLTVGSGATAQTISAAYDTAYDTPGQLAALAGAYKGWSGHSGDPFPSTFTVDATGTLRVQGGCNHVVHVTPRAATGVFDITLRNGCSAASAPLQQGILIFDAALQTIAVLSPLNADDMVMVAGTRQ
jgi:hypothetical protein